MVSPRGWGGPPARRPWEEAESAQRQRDIERTLTAVSAKDVQLAERRREQERLFAELTLGG